MPAKPARARVTLKFGCALLFILAPLAACSSSGHHREHYYDSDAFRSPNQGGAVLTDFDDDAGFTLSDIGAIFWGIGQLFGGH